MAVDSLSDCGDTAPSVPDAPSSFPTSGVVCATDEQGYFLHKLDGMPELLAAIQRLTDVLLRIIDEEKQPR